MASVTGFGGVFLRADDPKALYAWYEQHLGLAMRAVPSRFLHPRNTLTSSSLSLSRTTPTSARAEGHAQPSGR